MRNNTSGNDLELSRCGTYLLKSRIIVEKRLTVCSQDTETDSGDGGVQGCVMYGSVAASCLPALAREAREQAGNSALQFCVQISVFAGGASYPPAPDQREGGQVRARS